MISQIFAEKLSSKQNTPSTKQTNKQNITTGIEIKNKLTGTTGEVGEDNGGEGGKGFEEQL